MTQDTSWSSYGPSLTHEHYENRDRYYCKNEKNETNGFPISHVKCHAHKATDAHSNTTADRDRTT